MSTWSVSRPVTVAPSAGGRGAAHRRHRLRGALAGGVSLVLVASLLAFVPGLARRDVAEAAIVPPGGLVSSADNFGSSQGSFAVTNDGAATYNLPLWAPRGRGAVTPNLSLSFNSRAGNGMVGVAWSLGGLSSVAPCPQTVAQDGFTDGVHFDGTDVYCLGGNRLIPIGAVVNGQREYRTEVASFARIIAYGMQDNVPDFVKVWAKDGTISTFGDTADSRVQAFRLKAGTQVNTLVPDSTNRVTLAWSLNKVQDRNGNTANVLYERAEGTAAQLWHVQARPSRIQYPPNREVRFSYVDRPDPIDGFGSGVHTREPKRLSKVAMFGGPQGGAAELLREYRLAYRNNSITGRSLLTSVIACDGEPKCMRPVTFDWTTGSYNVEPIATNVTEAGQPMFPWDNPDGYIKDNRIIVGDINGDGKDDLLYPRTDQPMTGGYRQTWRVRLSNGNGFAGPLAAGFQTPAEGCPDQDDRSHCHDWVGKVRAVDVDADGRMDVMVWVPWSAGQNKWRLFTWSGSAFAPYAQDVEPETDVDEVGEANLVHFADLDGNGLPDYISRRMDSPDGNNGQPVFGTWRYRLNTGAAGTGRFSGRWDTGRRNPDRPEDNKVIDANGDGRVDLVGYATRREGDQVSLGAGWGLDNLGAVQTRSYAAAVYSSVAGDINGDGLEDAIDYTVCDRICLPPNEPTPPGHLVGSVGSGTGYAPYSQSPGNFPEPPRPCLIEGGQGLPTCRDPFDQGIRIVDFNGDGHDDVVVFRGGTPTDENDVSRGLQVYLWRDGTFERVPLRQHAGYRGPHGFAASQVLDVDGDGMLDILHVDGDHLRLLRRTGGVPDRLVRIGDGITGPTVEVDYATLASRTVHTPCQSAYPVVCQNRGGSVVATHRLATGLSGTSAWNSFSHTYEGARIDSLGRGWLGFARHTVDNSQTGARTVTDFDNSSRNTATKTYPFALLPKTSTFTEIDQPGGRYQQRTVTNQYAQRLLSPGFTVELRQTTTVDKERAAVETTWQTLRTVTASRTYDEFGNATASTSQTTGGRRLHEVMGYDNNETDWLIGQLRTRDSTGCTTAAATVCTTRQITVDYYPNGNPKTTVVEPNNPALKLSTLTVYGTSGTVASVTESDVAGQARTTSYGYDADLLHPTTVTNPLGHQTTTHYHSGLGVALDTTDPNGVVTTMSYDRFGRLRETNHADGSFQHITHQLLLSSEVTTSVDAGGGRQQSVRDRLGREVSRGMLAFNGATVLTATTYDRFGRVATVSRPYLTTETNPPRTAYTYDNHGRQLSETAPDGVRTRHTYTGLETHNFDGKGIESYTVSTVNGDAGFSFQDDPNSTSWLRTRFEYGPFGETTKTEAPDLTAKTVEYDILGRPKTSTDPAGAGVTTTTYTAFGESATVTNGAGQTTTYSYDKLGRMTQARSPDGRTTNTWDTAENGIGKLASADSSDNVFTRYGYDDKGHQTHTSWKIDGTTYVINTGYDGIGRPSTTIYPNIPGASGRLSVTNVYNAYGYLKQIQNSASAGTVYWRADTRDPAGQLTKETLGNGVVSTRQYQPQTGQLTHITTTGPGTIGTLDEHGYGYDPNRNVTSHTNPAHQRSDTYTYDSLDRLKTWRSATVGGASVNAAYTYDKIGNLKTESVTGVPDQNATYTYGENGAPAHALTGRNGANYGYDGAGRRTTGPNGTVAYTTFNLPRTLTDNNNISTEFRYDASNARVTKQTLQNTITTLGGLFERRSPHGHASAEIWNLHNIIADGRVVAQVNRAQAATGGEIIDTRVVYLHADMQASTTLVTNMAGQVYRGEDSVWANLIYDPWGRRLDTGYQPLGNNRNSIRDLYTGHEHDDELGLINMKGRIYDPVSRRFFSPDPVNANPLSSQTHNGYGYVQSNPATFTDPTGLWRSDSFYDGIGFSDSGMMSFEPEMTVAAADAAGLLSGIMSAYGLTPNDLNARILSLAGAQADDDQPATGGGGGRVRLYQQHG